MRSWIRLLAAVIGVCAVAGPVLARMRTCHTGGPEVQNLGVCRKSDVTQFPCYGNCRRVLLMKEDTCDNCTWCPCTACRFTETAYDMQYTIGTCGENTQDSGHVNQCGCTYDAQSPTYELPDHYLKCTSYRDCF